MSSVRGQGIRGRGRGSSSMPPASARGRGSSRSRGRVYGNAAAPNHLGAPTATWNGFGQPSRQTATQRGRGPFGAAADVTQHKSAPVQAHSSSVAKSRGSWADRYQALTTARDRERADAIKRGLIADPDKPRALADAITPVGTCQDMCAEYERVQRVVQKDVWDEETDPNHSAYATTENEPDEARMVKKFRRAAAGLEEQLPSDLRPPTVLSQTCDYLFNEVVGKASSLAHVHHFVWDRTRAVRNDFSIQQVTKPEELRIAIDCYERIARFHIVSLHQLALPQRPYSKYDWQQEREQLDRTLLSLMQYYDDCRSRIELPNEAEFRAYCVIFQLQDPIPDLEDRIQTWPRQILRDSTVQKAMEVYMAACNVLDSQGPLKPRASHLIARQDWQRFWLMVASKETSYLMACVAEIYFDLVRRTVLVALFKTSRANSNLPTSEWTVDLLCDLLALDEEQQVIEYCTKFGFSFREREEDGQQYLDLTSVKGRTLPEQAAGWPKQTKTNLVEDKRFGRTIPSVINGLSVKQARDAGLTIEEEDDGMDDVMNKTSQSPRLENGEQQDETIDDGESLFIPEASRPASQRLEKHDQGRPSPFHTGAQAFGGFGAGSTFGKPSNSINGATADSNHPSEQKPASSPVSGAAPSFTFDKPPAATTTILSVPQQTTQQPLFAFNTGDKAASEFVKSNGTKPAFSWSPPTSSAPSTSSLFTPQFQFSAPSGPPSNEAHRAGAGTSQMPSPPPSFFPQATTQQPGPLPVPSPEAVQPLEVKAPQPQPQSPPHFITAPPSPSSLFSPGATNNSTGPHAALSSLGQGLRRSPSVSDNRPKKPSPLHNSITASEDNVAVADSEEPANGTPSSVHPDSAADELLRNSDRIAEEFFYAPVAGVLDQYVKFHVSHAIKEAKAAFEQEQENKIADEFRHCKLEQRYGSRWRKIFAHQRLAKSGRERRQRRQRRLQERASAEFEGASNLGRESSSSRAGSYVQSFEPHQDIHDDMGAFASRLAASHSSNGIQMEQQAKAGSKRPASSHGSSFIAGQRADGHKRLKSTSHVDDRGRVTKPVRSTPKEDAHASLLRRSAFLAFSSDTSPPPKNTTTSSYFRLKAMGLQRIENSATSRGTKRRLSDASQSLARTSPPSLRSSLLRSSQEDFRQKALMPPPPASVTSRASQVNEEDEALLARLRAARENLSQSTAFYKNEVTKDDEFRKSLQASQSSQEYDSPTMAQARADARLRASTLQNAGGKDIPAYRLRESKFVPREQYGRAIERAREIREAREARSREASRPLSRTSFLDVQKDRGIEDSNARSGEIAPTAAIVTSFDSTIPDSVANGQVNDPSPARLPPPARAQNGFASFGQFTPLNLANHTTQLSNVNPFLQSQTQRTFKVNEVQPAAVPEQLPEEPPVSSPMDQTIQPSQINKALANSFGESHAHGQNHQFSLSKDLPPMTQQNSYLATQATQTMSFMVDDGAESESPKSVLRANVSEEAGDASEELLDDASEDEDNLDNNAGYPYPDPVDGPYAHANRYSALFAQGDDAEDEEDGYDRGGDETDYDEESHDERNGFAQDHDDEGVYGDVDEDETQENSPEVEQDGYDYYGEDGPEDEEAGYDYAAGRNLLWAGLPHGQVPAPSPLKAAGNNVEEAIELSD